MNFQEAQDYLINLTKFGFNFGLGRISELLRRNGDPHSKLKVIHVGGTNGKGSTCAMISSILQEAGYKVGLFTSPHLHSYCERFQINREPIPEERMAEMITRLKPQLEEMVRDGFEHPTEFEVSTAAGFIYFYEEKVDFLVLEVGLGGAIDSTNVVTPLVSVITNVAMDHMDYLGQTIREITQVKAGIIKEQVPVVTAADQPDALEVIQTEAALKHSKLIIVGQDIKWQEEDNSFFSLTEGLTMRHLKTSLIGQHQIINAVTAMAAIRCLEEHGVSVPDSSIREGLNQTNWPARLELVSESPRVLLDGAHNEAGAATLEAALEKHFSYNRLILVIGMLADKEREKVVARLAPLAASVIVTRPNSPRAGAWQKLAEEVKHYVSDVTVIEDVHTAVRNAMKLAESEDLICVTGSLYMVSEARELFI